MLQLQLMCRKKGNIAVQVVTIINPADVPVFKDQTHNWVSWCIHWWAGWVGDFTRCLTMLSHLMSSSYLKAAPRPDLLVSTRLTWLECHGGARGGGSVLVVIETAWIYDSSLTRVVRIYMLHMKNKNTSLICHDLSLSLPLYCLDMKLAQREGDSHSTAAFLLPISVSDTNITTLN